MKFSVPFIVLASLASVTVATTYYVDSSNAGDDLASGTSSATPWKTIGRVNVANLIPGDTVRLIRGGQWRESLTPRSGNSSAVITYTWYGDTALPKPSLIRSLERNDPSSWTNAGGSIWTTGKLVVTGTNILPNPSFSSGTSYWSVYFNTAGGASGKGSLDTVIFDTAPASFNVTISTPGSTASDVQAIVTPFNLTADNYRLTFRARSSVPGTVPSMAVHKAVSPWTSYASLSTTSFNLTTGWATYTTIVTTLVRATDTRLTLFLGGAFPSGTVIHIDTFSLEPVSGVVPADVGNIIFDNSIGGDKEWTSATVTSDRQFSFEDGVVSLFSSAGNPANVYSDIELALTIHIVYQSGCSYVTYDGLDLRYGAAHGFAGGSTHHITIRNCDIGWIGGGKQYDTVRYGNGIEFWCGAHDNLVEKNRVFEVYDAALTNQCTSVCQQVNITYRYNLVYNSEYCFEYWNRPNSSSTTRNVRFENNVCLFSGYGWGHTTRPDPSGRHLCFFSNTAATSEMFIRNNVFMYAREAACTLWQPNSWFWNITEDFNLFIQNGTYLFLPGTTRYDNRTQWLAATGMDVHSIFTDPVFVSLATWDIRLLANSSAIDAGTNTGATSDLFGNPVPQGLRQDIGAFEWTPAISSSTKHSSLETVSDGVSVIIPFTTILVAIIMGI